ncbi:DNA/RNA helicase [Macleaya cordata]|uniref:DNA/RNA helicase n=1 Tax=Macleaya cordata TaxID=56857 RepID=A0A200Q2D9_MACCD|nr:DNA/RNA helicase [Macleaya cordata]
MAKGDDAVRKKKNKVLRKRFNKDPSNVPARIAAIIASKQRRKNGKRRMCEGMCFSLPTPEDPFNDRYNNKAPDAKKAKKPVPPKADTASKKPVSGKNSEKVEDKKSKEVKTEKGKNNQKKSIMQQGGLYGNTDSPSKFLIMCLNAIQKAFLDDGTFDGDMDKPFLVNTWGIKFWKCCSAGLDILETTGSCSTIEQIAWMISTAADIFGRKEKEGLSIATPFLLFLVPSQEKAIKVRSVCKPIKALGIHTVSLHSGASLDHQIQGLRNCKPEFLVSTPERLLELISSRAIDISGVSLLVIDGLESFIKDGFLDKIKSIRQSVSGDPQTVIFNKGFDPVSTSTVQNLLQRQICRLPLNDSIASQSACISQCVHACSSEEEKLSKGIQILNEARVKRSSSQLPKVLLVAGTISKAQLLATAFAAEDNISNDATCDPSQVATSKKMAVVSVTDFKTIKTMDIGGFEVILVVDFPLSIADYVRILTGMARHTVDGVLHSFFCHKDAPLARPLSEVLEQCGQTVPETLRNYYDSSSMLEN